MAVDMEKKRELEQSITEYSEQKRILEHEYRKSKGEEDQLRDRLTELDEERTALNAELVAINDAKTALQSAQTRLAQQMEKKRVAEANPDTTEEDLAKVQQKQLQCVMERVEHALTMEVFLRKTILTLGICQRGYSDCGGAHGVENTSTPGSCRCSTGYRGGRPGFSRISRCSGRISPYQ
jgi:predicted nuclease with TOPRIM domain